MSKDTHYSIGIFHGRRLTWPVHYSCVTSCTISTINCNMMASKATRINVPFDTVGRYARFEEKHNYIQSARKIYERAVEFFGEENMEEVLIVAFARFEENQREVRHRFTPSCLRPCKGLIAYSFDLVFIYSVCVFVDKTAIPLITTQTFPTTSMSRWKSKNSSTAVAATLPISLTLLCSDLWPALAYL